MLGFQRGDRPPDLPTEIPNQENKDHGRDRRGDQDRVEAILGENRITTTSQKKERKIISDADRDAKEPATAYSPPVQNV